MRHSIGKADHDHYFISCITPTPQPVSPKTSLFQQHWRHLKGNYDLNSAFEKAERLLEQKRTIGSHFHYIAPLTL